jgi:hypothetical protein
MRSFALRDFYCVTEPALLAITPYWRGLAWGPANR